MTRSRKQKKTKKKSPVTTNSQSAELALSSLHEKIEALKADQQWLLKQIKRKRTELKNLVEQMQDISRQIFQRCSPIMQQMMERDQEIHQLFSEIFAKRKMGKKSLKKVKNIYESLQRDGVISPKRDAEDDSPFSNFFSEEFSETDSQENQQQQSRITELSDPPSNQRKIRETFLRLASRFHPDKVTDSETQSQYTAIMQEVNKAYQDGDFAKLLEIERKQHDADAISVTSEADTDTEKQHSQLMRENELLKQQYEEIKQEVRYLRNTPEGSVVTDYRRATKEGIDPIAEMEEQAEGQLEFITEVRDFVRDFRDKKITVQQFIEGPNLGSGITIEDLEMMLEEMFEAEFS